MKTIEELKQALDDHGYESYQHGHSDASYGCGREASQHQRFAAEEKATLLAALLELEALRAAGAVR